MQDSPNQPHLAPLLKWTGGKRSEIPTLRPCYPSGIRRIIEPFAGGAAVSLDLNPGAAVLNDLSPDLMAFYRAMQDPGQREAVIASVAGMDALRKAIASEVAAIPASRVRHVASSPAGWLASRLQPWCAGLPALLAAVLPEDVSACAASKAARVHALELRTGTDFDEETMRDHLETGLQSGVYTSARRAVNGGLDGLDAGWRVGLWWLVRALCYSGMFRYARNGNFNVPYGGIGYNRRDFIPSIAAMRSPALTVFMGTTRLHQVDFEELFGLYDSFAPGDFVFVDPPYDSAFSKYNRDGDFTASDQERLAAALRRIKAPWMLVIKHTPFILSLYRGVGLHRGTFGKTYQVNFRNRHDRAVEHLVVTNYPLVCSNSSGMGLQPLD